VSKLRTALKLTIVCQNLILAFSNGFSDVTIVLLAGNYSGFHGNDSKPEDFPQSLRAQKKIR